MRVRSALLLSLVALAAFAAFAAADEIVLKGGGRVSGDVTSREDGRIVLQTAYGSVTFESTDISEVRYSSAREKEIRDQLKGLSPTDIPGRLKLASQASAEGYADLSKSVYTQVIALDADDKTARAALGYVSFEGEWVTPKDRALHPGLVPYQGKWLSAEDRDALRKADENEKYLALFNLSQHDGNEMLSAIADLDVTIEPRGGYIVRRHVETLPVKDKPYVYSVDILNWQRLGVFVGVTFIDGRRKKLNGFGELKYTIYSTETDTLGTHKIGKEILSQTITVTPEMWNRKSDFKYWDTKISSMYEKLPADAARKAWSDEYYMNNDGALYFLANRDINLLAPPGTWYIEASFKMGDKEKKIGRFVQYSELR
jgi:hypothetical protein